LSRCVTPLVFMSAHCLRCWNDYVQRCSLKLLLLFSLNVNLNIEEKTLYMQYYHNCTISLVHTVSDFSPGVATVWTHRDHTVATPASTALNRDKSCWAGVHRDVAPVVSKNLKPPGLTGTHWAAKQHRLIPGHHRSSSGINRISTVKPPGETVANRHELCPRWRYSDSRRLRYDYGRSRYTPIQQQKHY